MTLPPAESLPQRVCVADLGIVRKTEFFERVNGIEPSYAAWEATVLPLNYTRNLLTIRGRSNLHLDGPAI